MLLNSLLGNEVIVLRLLGLGYNVQAIARKIFLSEAEVEQTIKNLMEKLDLNCIKDLRQYSFAVFGNN